MKANRLLGFHQIFKAFILFGFAMYIVYLVKSGHIDYYIAPRMVNYVKYSALALYVIAVFQIYAGVRSLWGDSFDCECEHPPSKSFLKNGFIYGLFMFPLLLGFLTPDTLMSSVMADKKGMSLTTNTAKGSANTVNSAKSETPQSNPRIPVEPNTSNNEGQSANKPDDILKNKEQAQAANPDKKLAEMFKTDSYNEAFGKYGMILYKKDMIQVKDDIFMEVLTTLDLFKSNFTGKKIELSGFVYRPEDIKDNQIVVGRFAIQCCSADASPYGVMVEFDHAKNYKNDTWVKITGTIDTTSYHENEILKVKATKVEKINAPKSPYISPNYDFMTQFEKQ